MIDTRQTPRGPKDKTPDFIVLFALNAVDLFILCHLEALLGPREQAKVGESSFGSRSYKSEGGPREESLSLPAMKRLLLILSLSIGVAMATVS